MTSTIDAMISAICIDICELPDRTSPDDQPAMMLVTGDELASILRRHLLSLHAQNERYREALIASRDTKAAYIGEFGFSVELTNAEGETYSQPFTVPWTTIKEIMAAIRKRAEDQP